MGWEAVQAVDTVHCFMTIEKNGEVDTSPIIQWLYRIGKRVVIPKSVKETKELKHYVYNDHDQLVENEWGIPEPVGGEEVRIEELDLILVPMIAADMRKNRLGYGLGFYDRFLARSEAIKTGLLFDACLSDISLPVEQFDVQLDFLVTEKGIF